MQRRFAAVLACVSLVTWSCGGSSGPSGPSNALQFVGNTAITPADGAITDASTVAIQAETQPKGAAESATAEYSLDGGSTWLTAALTKGTATANGDLWQGSLGAFSCGAALRYRVKATQGSNTLSDVASGQEHQAHVNTPAHAVCKTAVLWNGYQATLSVQDADTSTRTYVLTTDQPGRGSRAHADGGGTFTYAEQAGQPIVRSGNAMFDALFALANEDMRRMSVSTISDGSYGQNIPCPASGTGGCFQTGVLWTYVWTRDSAYAIDLGLAQLDPTRSANTLLFKTSPRRATTPDASTAEIVQDTGSGGSWPISSDRVVWARGAWEVLKYLSGTARTDFESRAYTAIKNTVENDRSALWDANDGLYRGEMSFLDWREQSYPNWTKNDVFHIGMSKALATNVDHWKALDVAAQLATELGQTADATRYRGWADALKTAIDAAFWIDDAGLYSIVKPTYLDPAPERRYDLLGESLAILDGVADATKATSILSKYPHAPAGATVMWPEQNFMGYYHNGAIWPFVTAYAARAGRVSGHDAIVNAALWTLMRGAALTLTNMENLLYKDLSPQGTAVNSEAQLWSIGGYLNAVMEVTFGREATQTGIRFHPFVTHQMRNELFAGSDEIKLLGLPYQGKLIDVRVQLPAGDGSSVDGFYKIAGLTLNGTAVTDLDTFFTVGQLADQNEIVIALAEANAPQTSITVVDNPTDDTRFKAPRNPNILATGGLTVDATSGLITVSWDAGGETGTVFSVYRNGQRVAEGLTATSWTDPNSASPTKALCYAVEQKLAAALPAENMSHRSLPVCWWPAVATEITAGDPAFTLSDNQATIVEHGKTDYSNWGQPAQTMDVAFTTPANGAGRYLIQIVYGNAFNSVSTGVTDCVKQVDVYDPTDTKVASGVVAMPHRTSWDDWGGSTFVTADLAAGTTYRVHLSDLYNMSYLQSNATYLSAGGASGAVNRANIASFRFQLLESGLGMVR